MDILDDKLSAKVFFFKVNYSFKLIVRPKIENYPMIYSPSSYPRCIMM